MAARTRTSRRHCRSAGSILKKFAKAYVKFVTKVALNILLIGLYLFGFGPSSVLARLLRLSIVRNDKHKTRFWLPAEGYDADETNSLEQS